jgi:hypothetical protein
VHGGAIIRLFGRGVSAMKLTDDISTSPHAAATQVGDDTVVVIMSRDVTLALADKVVRTAGGRFEYDLGTFSPVNTAHLVETNSP